MSAVQPETAAEETLDELDWCPPFRRRCPAYAVVDGYQCGCDLRRGHSGAHAAERGMDTPMWRDIWVNAAGVPFDRVSRG